MAPEQIVHAVRQHLVATPGSNVFAILDGASIPGLLTSLYRYQPDYVCLYRGEIQPDMAEVAPYLIRLDPSSACTAWIIERGWGNHWGIFALSDADLRTMRQHFRRFLIVHDSSGKPLLFRYYDPRVWRTYLPTCTAEELAAVFGPVTYYIFEDDNPEIAIRCRTVSGALQQNRLRLA
jgi:hypothetical protein